MGVCIVRDADAHFVFMKHYQNFELKNLICFYKGTYYAEEWRPLPVKEFENYYMVSSFGRLKSLREGAIMKQYMNEKGYLTVSFSACAIRKKFKAHRMVCLAFNKNQHDKPEVNHDDFDKANNFFKNLIWATSKENTHHAQEGGRSPKAKPKPPKNNMGRPARSKKVIDTNTGFVYDSVEHLVNTIGGIASEIRKKLNGERANTTKYKYLTGEYSLFYTEQYKRDMQRFYELRKSLLGY